nr:MAG TPA: hypothetical protein [Caudoviricetes sp.]
MLLPLSYLSCCSPRFRTSFDTCIIVNIRHLCNMRNKQNKALIISMEL